MYLLGRATVRIQWGTDIGRPAWLGEALEKGLSETHSPVQAALSPHVPLVPWETLSRICHMLCYVSLLPAGCPCLSLVSGPRNSCLNVPKASRMPEESGTPAPHNPFLPSVWCQVSMPGPAAAALSQAGGTCQSSNLQQEPPAKGQCPRSPGKNVQTFVSQRNGCCIMK